MAKTIFEELGGRYERQGDYLIPCLTVPAEKEQSIVTWGQRHLVYLKQYRKAQKCFFIGFEYGCHTDDWAGFVIFATVSLSLGIAFITIVSHYYNLEKQGLHFYRLCAILL